MKKVIYKIFLIIDILVFLFLIFFSQFLIRHDAISGTNVDGFGRVLTSAPIMLQSTGLMEEWAGFGWFLADTACALVLIGIAYLLFKAINKKV